VPSTVGGAAADRVARALGSLQVFKTIETEATAYDATLAVGSNHLMVATNFKVAILNKSGAPALPETDLQTWFTDVLTSHTEVDFVFDPRVLYDQHDERWILVASGVHHDDFTSGIQLLSVSTDKDPTKPWKVWGFPEKEVAWPDHPCLGADAHALYLSANLYSKKKPDPQAPFDFKQSRLRVIPKAAPYAGGVVTFTEFADLQNPVDPASGHKDATQARTVFPCHTWGAPGGEYLVSTWRDNLHTKESRVVLWTVTDAAGTPKLTNQPVTVPEYAVRLPDAIQQGSPKINAGDAKIRSAVFNGGSIWFAFATAQKVQRPGPGVSEPVGVARWYKIEPGGNVL